ncbi:hypothetical protein C0966_08755 [Bacillus methanolicus]|nr:hypothetical protein [Bacillus methanolicus]
MQEQKAEAPRLAPTSTRRITQESIDSGVIWLVTSRGWALLEKLTLFFVRSIASVAFLVEPDYDKLHSKLYTTYEIYNFLNKK